MHDGTGKKMAERPIRIAVDRAVLDGDLAIPAGARGLVVFVHGSGSSRFSSRNRFVAQHLQREGMATLLFDLLTRQEEESDNFTGRLRFDIELLAGRLAGVTQWALAQEEIGELPMGYFGASTGAAAALIAETRNPAAVRAIVSRGGRPDLAGQALSRVQAPTLLIVGGNDDQVVLLNEQAFHQLQAKKRMVIVPGATHLFEEPGTLEAAAQLAAKWFRQYLASEGGVV
ncbi:MAG: dienelactone hydrolase family protein [Deltaproteobacteria bacterium]|nr:dienelactone hydrolase family protein [Deltaproteobacteria bacterium]